MMGKLYYWWGYHMAAATADENAKHIRTTYYNSVSMNINSKCLEKNKIAPCILVSALVLLMGVTRELGAEPSHHQGSNPGLISIAGVDRLASKDTPAGFEVRAFASYLKADQKFDTNGDQAALGGNGSVQNQGLNLFAEYRAQAGWAASLLTGGQYLDIKSSAGDQSIWSLSDSTASGRYTIPLANFGTLSGVLGVKVPGTYPEKESTGAKQIDQETKFILAIHNTGIERLAVLVGVGYKLRLSSIEDEITPTLMLPVRLTGALTITPVFTGGIAIGMGTQAQDALTTGGIVAYRFSSAWEIHAAYYRTVWGHNVVSAHIVTAGVALRGF